MNSLRRWIALLISSAMMLTMLPINVFAETLSEYSFAETNTSDIGNADTEVVEPRIESTETIPESVILSSSTDDSISLSDSSDEFSAALISASDTQLLFDIENNLASTVIAAVYSKDGQMLACKIQDLNKNAGTTAIDMPFYDTSNAGIAKLLFVENADTLTPIQQGISFDVAPFFEDATDLCISSISVACNEYTVGESALWTATAQNGHPPYQYLFDLYCNGMTIYSQPYSLSNSFSYTFAEPGSYYVTVSVKDNNSNSVTRQSDALSICVAEDTNILDFTYEVVDDEYVVVTGYTGTDTEVIIPGKIEGISVCGIADFTFEDHTDITKLVIPSSVMEIGFGAFSGCSSLKSINIPEGISELKNGTFGGCSNLSEISIPETVETIGSGVFSGCSSLKQVDIPAKVKKIDLKAFDGCSELEIVKLPEGLTHIDRLAFFQCKKLKEINIPDTVTDIGTCAFGGCTALTGIVLPKNLTEIADELFQYCNNLTSVQIPEGVTTIGASAFHGCALKQINIPATVTEIGSRAFLECDFTEIDLPNGITVINDQTFWNCSALERIVIPNTVITIGENVFRHCYNLTKVTIPESVTSIGARAFYNCQNLKRLLVPENVQTIGEEAFSRTNMDFMLTVAEDSAAHHYAINNNIAYRLLGEIFLEPPVISLVNKTYNTITISWDAVEFAECYDVYCSNVPYGAYTFIGTATDTSFCHADLECITEYCYKVVAKAGEKTSEFSNILEIETEDQIITLAAPTGVTADVISASQLKISWNCVDGAEAYRIYVAKENEDFVWVGSTYSGDKTWYELNGLTANSQYHIYVIASACNISGSEFTSDSSDIVCVQTAGIFKIDEVNVESQLLVGETMDATVMFSGAYGKVLFVYRWLCNGSLVYESEPMHSPECSFIPSSGGIYSLTVSATDTLGRTAEYTVASLNVFQPLTVEVIAPPQTTLRVDSEYVWTVDVQGGTAPYTISYELSVKIGDYWGSNTGYSEDDGTISVKFSFSGETHLVVTVTDALGESITVSQEFVVEAAIPVTYEMQENGTYCVTGLANPYLYQDITIPAEIDGIPVTEIADRAFYDMEVLTGVTMPDSITHIGDQAFYLCRYMEFLNLSENLISIGDEAFYECEQLTEVTFNEGLKSIGESAFAICKQLKEIRLPSTIEDLGNRAFALCTTAKHVYIPETMTEIGEGMFLGCTSLTEINIPQSITHIGGSAFSECDSLTTVTVPQSVTHIGADAFAFCRSLSTISLPDRLITLEHGAFKDTAIETINLPSGLTTIPDGLFARCVNLEAIVIPNGVTEIGTNAFASCESLKVVVIPETVLTIKQLAFANCQSLQEVTIPWSTVSIADEAFGVKENASGLVEFNFSESVALNVEKGSAAEKWALQQSVPYTATACEHEFDPWIVLIAQRVQDQTGLYPAYLLKAYCNFEALYMKVDSSKSIFNGTAFEGLTYFYMYEYYDDVDLFQQYVVVPSNQVVDFIASYERYGDGSQYIYSNTCTVVFTAPEVQGPSLLKLIKDAEGNFVDDDVKVETCTFEGQEYCDYIMYSDVVAQNRRAYYPKAYMNGTYQLDGTLCGFGEKITSVAVRVREQGRKDQEVTIWTGNPDTTLFEMSSIPVFGIGETYTDASGKSITMQEGKYYEFIIYAELANGASFRDGSNPVQPISVVPAPTMTTLTGTISNAKNTGLSDVIVTIYDYETGTIICTTATDTNGRWETDLAMVGGHYQVHFQKAGYVFSPAYLTCTSVPATGFDFQNVIAGIGSNSQNGFAVSHGTVDGLVAGYAGGRGMTITVVSTGKWTVVSDSDWIALSVSSGQSEETFYPIIAENTEYAPRTGYITVSCEGYESAVIRVVQKAAVREAAITVNQVNEKDITDTSAVVCGMLTWGEGESARSYQNIGIQYGLNDGSDWLATISAALDSETGALVTTVGELRTGAEYRFRAVAQHTETLEWMVSEPVAARIQKYCDHQYGDMFYAYDSYVKVYHDRYLETGNKFLPTAFIKDEETADTHAIRHPYICVCALCDRFEVLYANGVTDHTFETITESAYENITDGTHDLYQVTRVMCTAAIGETLCGYTQSEDRILLEESVPHVFEDGVCVCGKCNVVWAAELRDTLYIDVTVKSGHPNAAQNYLFIAEDSYGRHYSATIAAGKTSISFAIKNDLGLSRAQTYKIYILPENTALTSDNRAEYYLGEMTIPLYKGKLVTSVYSGDTKVTSSNNVYVGDVIRINWDGSYGVNHAQITAKLNTNEVFSHTYYYSGPGTVSLDSTAIGATAGDQLIVTVTVDPNEGLPALMSSNVVQPVTYTWTGQFVARPTAGYVIELDWGGKRTDVTNQRVYMTTSGGQTDYFGLRAYLDGELINLTDPDNCLYEWVIGSFETKIEDGYEVAYAYDLTMDEKTGYFKGSHPGSWCIKRQGGYTFYFNKNGDGLRGYIKLQKKGEDEALAYAYIRITSGEILISGAEVGYSASDREYNEAVSISTEMYNSWYTGASLAERRLWFDLNVKRSLIDITVPSNTVENFFDACEESFLWDLRYNGVLLTLKASDFLGNVASDVVDLAIEGVKHSVSWPAALYSDVKYGTGDFNELFKETTNYLNNYKNTVINGKVMNSFTHHDKHTDAIINYLMIKAEDMAKRTGRSDFEKTTVQSVVDGLAALKKTTDSSLKNPLDKLIDWVQDQTNHDFAQAFTMDFDGIELGEVMVDVRIGSKTKTFTLEQVLSASELTGYTVEYGNKSTLEFLTKLRDGGIDVDAEHVSKQGTIWTFINSDTKVDLYNEMYPGSKMMNKLGAYLKANNVDAWLDAADAGINGYKAWATAEQYDKLLTELEDYLVSLEPSDNQWVQDVIDKLTDAASNSVLEALEAIGETYLENGMKKLTSVACQKALTKLFREGAELAAAQACTLASAAWTGIELGNMLSNAAGSVGTIPSVSEVIELYEDAQDGLYAAMDAYASSPSSNKYQDLKMKAELYTILKGSAIVSINAVYRAEQESIFAMFTNWPVLRDRYTAAFFTSLFTGDWTIFVNVQDDRAQSIADIDQAMSGELEQMQELLDTLFPYS